ncbi:MAG: hypothetical protein ACUVX9_15910 [Anaerolineae bacterium]
MGKQGDSSSAMQAVAQKSFFAGCFGCLGAGAGLIVFGVFALVVFQPQFLALIRALPVGALPVVISVQTGATPAAVVPANGLEVLVSFDSVQAVRLTQVKVPLTKPLFICVRGPVGRSVAFSVRLILPNGQVRSLGDFQTDASGGIVCVTSLAKLESVPGLMRVELVTGTTVLTTTTVEIVQ